MNTQFMIQQLTVHEGRKNKPYVDTVGKITIGIGRNLTDVGLSNTEIDVLLANDIQRSWSELISHLPWVAGLPESKQHVLLNMCFNMGITRLLGFVNFLDYVHRGAYAAASMEMLKSVWATQVGQRALDLSAQMRSS